VNLASFPFFADESIPPQVVLALREAGLDLSSAQEAGLSGQDDLVLLRHAYSAGRIILTFDADFGRLAVFTTEPVIGIVYLRPGHLRPQFTVASVLTLLKLNLDVQPPVLLVADRRGNRLKVRRRDLPPQQP
jgi:predicted nuclease of predicted toxin-antitoxin system